MRNARLGVILLLSFAACAQVVTFSRADLLKFTSKNPYGRFEDGRPKVPDEVLEKIREVSSEEIWSVLIRAGYPNQFEAGWQILHPEKKLIGRAVTAQYLPSRPDLSEPADQAAKAKGMAQG